MSTTTDFDPYATEQPCDNCGHLIPFDVDEGTIFASKSCLNCGNGHAEYGLPEQTVWV